MNKDSEITEREFEIINIIADGAWSNQRQLSVKTGMSLGMTNLLLRRLVTKGYLRAQQLNRKKVTYLLTPTGISEKARKGYHYTLKTIRSMALLKDRILAIFEKQLLLGRRNFVLLGKGDLQDLVELVSRDPRLKAINLQRSVEEIYQSVDHEMVLFVGPAGPGKAIPNSIDIAEALMNDSPKLSEAPQHAVNN